jgi:NAD-dependent dihydropyrimidine dehydrogenase PreA subunit
MKLPLESKRVEPQLVKVPLRRGWHYNSVRSYPDGGFLVTYVIAEPCVDVKDKSCIEECPVDCIYEGGRMLYIQPDECVDCGACEPVCPVEAIYYEDDVPGQWQEFGKINTEFFIEIGSPGGASKVGQTNTDHATVVALPAKPE